MSPALTRSISSSSTQLESLSEASARRSGSVLSSHSSTSISSSSSARGEASRRVTATSSSAPSSAPSEGDSAVEGVLEIVRDREPKEKASEGSKSVGAEKEDPGLVV